MGHQGQGQQVESNQCRVGVTAQEVERGEEQNVHDHLPYFDHLHGEQGGMEKAQIAQEHHVPEEKDASPLLKQDDGGWCAMLGGQPEAQCQTDKNDKAQDKHGGEDPALGVDAVLQELIWFTAFDSVPGPLQAVHAYTPPGRLINGALAWALVWGKAIKSAVKKIPANTQ